MVFLAVLPATFCQTPSLIAAYPETFKDNYAYIGAVYPNDENYQMSSVGQVLSMSADFVPTSFRLYLSRQGSLNGDLVVRIYPVYMGAIDATHFIAESSIVSASQVSSNSFELYDFTFETSTVLSAGNSYAFTLMAKNGNFDGWSNLEIDVGIDVSSPTALGSYVFHHLGRWEIHHLSAVIFYFYGRPFTPDPTLTPSSTPFNPNPTPYSPVPTLPPDNNNNDYSVPTAKPLFPLSGDQATFLVFAILIATIIVIGVVLATTGKKKRRRG